MANNFNSLSKLLFLLIIFFAINCNAQISEPVKIHIINQCAQELYNSQAFINNPVSDDIEVNLNLNKLPSNIGSEINCKITKLDKQFRQFHAQLTSNTNKKLNILINGNYDEYLTLPVLKQAIKKNTIINEEDITPLRVKFSNLKKTPITDINLIIGKTPKFFLQKNSAISLDDLILPKIIRKGEIVTVIYANKSISIKMTAQALESGTVGEVIKVKNTRSNTILPATVISSGVVQIDS
jgi:flagella basal body P-ring formation protein FlgA